MAGLVARRPRWQGRRSKLCPLRARRRLAQAASAPCILFLGSDIFLPVVAWYCTAVPRPQPVPKRVRARRRSSQDKSCEPSLQRGAESLAVAESESDSPPARPTRGEGAPARPPGCPRRPAGHLCWSPAASCEPVELWHRLNGYLAQRVPSPFLASSFTTCLICEALKGMFPWRIRYPLSEVPIKPVPRAAAGSEGGAAPSQLHGSAPGATGCRATPPRRSSGGAACLTLLV